VDTKYDALITDISALKTTQNVKAVRPTIFTNKTDIIYFVIPYGR